MAVFATRGVTFMLESGEFDCPGCGAPELFVRKTIRRFLTVGRLPVVPLRKVREFVECQQCGHSFAMDVIGDDPGPRFALERAELAHHVCRVMILAAAADGGLSPSRLDALRDVYANLAGAAPDAETLALEAAQVAHSGVAPADYVARFIEVFRGRGREAIALKAVAKILEGRGATTDEGSDVLRSVAEALETVPDPTRVGCLC